MGDTGAHAEFLEKVGSFLAVSVRMIDTVYNPISFKCFSISLIFAEYHVE